MRRTITPHLAEKAFSLIGPFMKEKKIVVAYFSEKRSSIIICHITSSKRVYKTVHNLSHWRCFQAKNYKT